MYRCKRFTVQHPVAFGFLLVVLFSILSTLTWPITQIKTSPAGYEVGTALAKLVIASCFLLLLWGFGWLRTAGFASCSNRRVWLLVSILMIYKAILGVYAFTGTFQFRLPGIELALAILLYSFATSLVEETMYRGLLLTAMAKAWGSTRSGLYAAAILSGLFWASMHFFNLLIRPFPVVALQVLETALAGFVYAAIVLASRSIWPAIIFHWAINAVISLLVSQLPNFAETIVARTVFVLAALPLVGVGIYVMQQVELQTGYGEETTYDETRLQPTNI